MNTKYAKMQGLRTSRRRAKGNIAFNTEKNIAF